MNRNSLETQSAVIKLENNYKRCVPFNCFGNDNKKQILGMLDVMKNNRTKVWINSAYLTHTEMFHEQPENVLWRSAMDARDWLDGKFEIEELLFNEVDVSTPNLLNGFF